MNPAIKRKRDQRRRRAAMGIKRVEMALSTRERQWLDHLCIARAGTGVPYSADEYISTLIRRDWELWLEQEAELNVTTCQHCSNVLPGGCGGAFKGEEVCWHTAGDKAIAL
ncbi:hypothetical protein [Aeromonas media]|uniref:hypothetical protein n=1 Tax=Aeromonas media TaxID=651 RepID=UPI003D0365C4